MLPFFIELFHQKCSTDENNRIEKNDTSNDTAVCVQRLCKHMFGFAWNVIKLTMCMEIRAQFLDRRVFFRALIKTKQWQTIKNYQKAQKQTYNEWN